jgi:hypothetical protein
MKKTNEMEVGKLYYQDWIAEITLFDNGNYAKIKKHEPFMILACNYLTPDSRYKKIDILTSQGVKIWFYVDVSKKSDVIHRFNTETPDTLNNASE